MDDDKVVQQLTNLVGRLRGKSRWAVLTAIEAAQTDDVALTLVLQFPGNPNKVPDAFVLGGAWQPQFADGF